MSEQRKVITDPRTKRCEDCDGTGREQIPCEAGDTDCEFCEGTGRVAKPVAECKGKDGAS